MAESWKTPSVVVAVLVSLISIGVSVKSCSISQEALEKSTEVNRISRETQSEKLLNEALDLMGGGTEGQPWINLKQGRLTDTEILNYEKARRKILEAIRLTPDFYMCHEYYGIYFQRKNNFQAAKECFERSIALNKRDSWPYSDYANLLDQHGKHKEAESNFKRAIELAPQDPNFHWNLSLHYQRLGNLEAAKREETEARRLAKESNMPFPFPK